MLVPEQPTRIGGKLVRPDGTLCDEYNLHRGYWEAKDTDDRLDTERCIVSDGNVGVHAGA